MYNQYVCPVCGAHLDPGEPCDCLDEVSDDRMDMEKGNSDVVRETDKVSRDREG